MKQKLLKTLFASLFLAANLPGYTLLCARPCAMTQKQLLSCAKACASLKGQDAVTLSSPDCVRLQAKADSSFLGAETPVSLPEAPEILATAFCVSVSRKLAPTALIFSRGSPSPSPVQLALLEVPTQNSPPVAA
jgi:hypothetical protein